MKAMKLLFLQNYVICNKYIDESIIICIMVKVLNI